MRTVWEGGMIGVFNFHHVTSTHNIWLLCVYLSVQPKQPLASSRKKALSHFAPRSMGFSDVIPELLLLKLREVLPWDHVPREGKRHRIIYGGFHKWGYLQIIHWNGIFSYKPCILGYLHSRKPPYKGRELAISTRDKHNICSQQLGAFGMSRPGSIMSLYPCQNTRVEHNLRAKY